MMRTALVCLGFLVWLVVTAYCFAMAERHNVVGECFELANGGGQAALCRALSHNSMKGRP